MGACQLVIRLEISGRKCQPSQAECPGLALQGWPVLGLGTRGGGACPTKTEICPPCRNVQGAAVSMPCRLKSLSHIEIKFSDQVFRIDKLLRPSSMGPFVPVSIVLS